MSLLVADAATEPWDHDPVLETERLALRPFARDDVARYQAMCADPEVMRYLGGPWTPAQTEQRMGASNRRFAAEGYSMIAVERRSDGRFLGSAGLTVERWYPDDLQLGWRLAPEHWGHGYATEAARAWMDYGFTAHHRDRIHAMADVPNHRSVAVMRRIGMQWDHEAALMDGDQEFDAVVYVITREQWQAGTAPG